MTAMRDTPPEPLPPAPDRSLTPHVLTDPLTPEQLHTALQTLPQPEINPDSGLRHTPETAATLTAEHRQLAIVDALTRGVSYRRIAEVYRCSVNTLTRLSRQLTQLEQGALANLMQLQGLAMLDHWRDAAAIAASEGKHAPARDWLTFSKLLETPTADASLGAKVTIIIGQPGRPAGGMTPEVLIGQSVTVNDDGSVSNT